MTNVENRGSLRQLCEWATAQRWEDLPVGVRRRARRVLADDLAAMIGATGETEVDSYRALVAKRKVAATRVTHSYARTSARSTSRSARPEASDSAMSAGIVYSPAWQPTLR